MCLFAPGMSWRLVSWGETRLPAGASPPLVFLMGSKLAPLRFLTVCPGLMPLDEGDEGHAGGPCTLGGVTMEATVLCRELAQRGPWAPEVLMTSSGELKRRAGSSPRPHL